MSKRIECTECAGMGKRLVKKSGVVKIATCKTCKGKGKVLDASKTKKTGKGKLVVEKKSKADRVMVVSRNLDDGTETKKSKLTDEQMHAKETIEERAAFFGCPGKVMEIRKGPVITLFEFKPAKTTRIKRLINLQEDLALAMSAEAVMVRRIPGKEVMGIEISNDPNERQNVAFRASLQSVKEAKQRGMELPLNLGTDPFGEPVIDDLATMPHLLIAGSTGSGKSVSLNCLISSLVTVCSPEELQFYMIDPKGVELTHYNGIPHMQEPMVTSPHYAKDMLERLTREMRKRLSMLTFRGVRDIKEYNEIARKEAVPTMPRIVMVIDELGDLMMQDRREFTRLIAEISQIARATGIHMIAATQRPSVDVLSGKIKVNFPGRMAFKVTSATDSKVIVHRKGAEGLLGRGDMLYLSPTRSTTIRIHAPWVPLDDVKTIAGKLKDIEAKRIAAEEARRAQARLQALGGEKSEQSKITLPSEAQLDINIDWASRGAKK
jgi:S-DNA-T family DNA segregation ATPase FtsK/SpoIIIE